ncbi:MAG: hypothetical protein AB3N14_14020 [Flavobacteriaceae bacterium]
MRKLPRPKINWKYIIGEVLLIFVGISLAIWFNNWNTERKTNSDKAIAIAKIEGEIHNNLEELKRTTEGNSTIKKAMDTYKAFHVADVGIVASQNQMREFQQEHPRFFKVEDSTHLKEDKWVYDGDTYINLELAELTKIAWETSKVTGITSAFGYECLYALEGTYNLQELVQIEMIKAVDALQDNDIDRLFRVLEFMEQYDSQLREDYDQALQALKNCK